jgi:hypothetical protein
MMTAITIMMKISFLLAISPLMAYSGQLQRRVEAGNVLAVAVGTQPQVEGFYPTLLACVPIANLMVANYLLRVRGKECPGGCCGDTARG